MDWIIRKLNEQNAERHRKQTVTLWDDWEQTIRRGAPALWNDVSCAVERAVRSYAGSEGALPVEFSGRAGHTIWVAVCEKKPLPQHGPARVTITFDEAESVIEVRSSWLNEEFTPALPISVNSAGAVCLTHDNREISVDEFTELA